MVEVLRTGKPASWASLRSKKEWAKAMEGAAFASQFTAAMDCRGVYLAPAMAQRRDSARYHLLLDVAGGSGIYACAIIARHPHLRATVLEKAPVERLAGQALAERGFAERVSVTTGDMFQDRFPEGCDIHLFSNLVRVKRHCGFTMTYLDQHWVEQTLAVEGVLAELLQHEIDHLDGVLAVSRAVDGASFALRTQRHLLAGGAYANG